MSHNTANTAYMWMNRATELVMSLSNINVKTLIILSDSTPCKRGTKNVTLFSFSVSKVIVTSKLGSKCITVSIFVSSTGGTNMHHVYDIYKVYFLVRVSLFRASLCTTPAPHISYLCDFSTVSVRICVLV